MKIGFVLMRVQPMMERKACKILSNTPGVVDFQAVFGEYDYIAKIIAEDVDGLSALVMKELRNIPGVVEAEAMMENMRMPRYP